MNDMEKTNSRVSEIERLLDGFLRSRATGASLSEQGQHLDEDSFAAFVEGNLSEREAQPILRHLVGCSFCRQITADLVRLDFAFADEEIYAQDKNRQPLKVAEVLSNLLSKLFGSGDATVFAHQESEEESKQTEKTKKAEDDKE